MTEAADVVVPKKPSSGLKTMLLIGGPATVLLITLLALASHFTTPRGRAVGTIALVGDGPHELEVDTGGKAIRFSIDLVTSLSRAELDSLAEKGRLEIVAESEGGAPLRATCATYAGSAHETPPNRSVSPQYLRGAELDCVIDATGRSKMKLHATATWPGGRPDSAVLTVRVGDER